MTDTKCHWDTDRGWVTAEHLADCDQHECAGCRPCGLSHCAMRGKCANHVQPIEGIITCPGCIGKVRKVLRDIEDRYDELEVEVEHVGVNSEVINLHGPAAFRVKLAPHDPHHPLLVLGRWDMMVREDYGHPTELAVTVSRSRDYLDQHLGVIANDDEQDFELFGREMHDCLTHLENVLSDSRAPEKGAPCPTCREQDGKGPRLHKVWAHQVADDHWQCPRDPAHKWGEVDYRARVAGDYLEHADRLTAADMHRQWDIKPGTLRKWAERGDVEKRGRDDEGRMLYDVAQARARADRDEDAA